MTEYIYGDVLFLINFSMDFVCLFITGKLTKTKMRSWRVALAAAVGAVYGVASLVYSLPTVIEILIETAVAFAVCAIGIWNGGAVKLLLKTAVFYAASVMLGGAMTFIYSRLGNYSVYIESGGNIGTVLGEVPLWVFLICAAASALLTRLFTVLIKNRSRAKTCRLSLTYGGKTLEMTGLIDSGNIASDPISGTPVIFVCTRYKDMLPSGVGMGDYAMKNTNFIRGMRAIPISTEGGGGIVFAIKADRCYVKTNGEYELRDALITVGKEEYYGDCDALVPLDMI